MTRVQLFAHDLARILYELKQNTPNRQAIFARSLESFAAFAVSESHLDNIKSTRADIDRVEQILKDSKTY